MHFVPCRYTVITYTLNGRSKALSHLVKWSFVLDAFLFTSRNPYHHDKICQTYTLLNQSTKYNATATYIPLKEMASQITKVCGILGTPWDKRLYSKFQIPNIWQLIFMWQFLCTLNTNPADKSGELWLITPPWRLKFCTTATNKFLYHDYILFTKSTLKYQDATTYLKIMKFGVPQGTVLGPFVCLICTADSLTIPDVMIATFTDNNS